MSNAAIAIQKQLKVSFGKRRTWIHVIFWVLAMLSFVGSYKYMLSMGKQQSVPPVFLIKEHIVVLVSLLGMCYSFLLLVLPLAGNQKRWWVFTVAFTGNILLWFTIKTFLTKLLMVFYPAVAALPDFQGQALWLRHYGAIIVWFVFFMSIYYFIDIYEHQQEIRRLERFKAEKIALEMNFLKSQINPHFLFNTLNNIYALSMVQSDEAPQVIDRLKGLMQYMLFECRADKVPLASEIAFMHSYLALEQIRHKTGRCRISFQVNGDPGDRQIAPLLLINFVENAFKHGVQSGVKESWVELQIDVNADYLKFELNNSKPPLHEGETSALDEYNGGIGIRNVRRRLEILYPRQHHLQISETPDQFNVLLTINL